MCLKYFGESFQYWILTFRVNVYFLEEIWGEPELGWTHAFCMLWIAKLPCFFDAMLLMLHCRGRVKVLGRHILEPQRQVRILFLSWDVSYEQNWTLSDENSRFEIKSSESSGGNISSFRNVASDLLDGLSWPQAFQQRLQHRCKVPILDRCEVLVVGAGPAGSIRLAAYWTYEIISQKKQTDGWN